MNNLTNFERLKGKLPHFGRDTSGFPRREKWEIKQLYKKFGFYVVPIAIVTILAFVAIIILIIALIILKWGTTPANSNVFLLQVLCFLLVEYYFFSLVIYLTK